MDVWQEYADVFNALWGIAEKDAVTVGANCKTLCQAEYTERGDASYADSVLVPLRNAVYSASVLDGRWTVLSKMKLVEPILDYGCGVGALLVYLRRMGFNDVMGHELDGIQKKVMREAFKANQIREWDGQQVETILCMNVLEHVVDPVTMLKYLMTVGKRVIANVCTAEGPSHIASHESLEECRKMLQEAGTLFA